MPRSDDPDVATRTLLSTTLERTGRGSRAELARRIGATRQTVSAWANGTLAIHPRWYLRLAEALDLEPTAFIEAAGKGELIATLNYDDLVERWSLMYPDGHEDRARSSSAADEMKITKLHGSIDDDDLATLFDELARSVLKGVDGQVRRPTGVVHVASDDGSRRAVDLAEFIEVLRRRYTDDELAFMAEVIGEAVISPEDHAWAADEGDPGQGRGPGRTFGGGKFGVAEGEDPEDGA